jgi:hypothetical protein
VQGCVSTGEPPPQPAGDDEAIVRVCVPVDWQAPQAEYVNDVQVVVGGT